MVSIGQNLAFRAAQLNSTTKKVQTEEENNTETTATTNETAASTQESNAKTLMPKSDVLLANIGVKINRPGTEENAATTAAAKIYPKKADMEQAIANGELGVGSTCYIPNGSGGYYVYLVIPAEDGRLQSFWAGSDKTAPSD